MKTSLLSFLLAAGIVVGTAQVRPAPAAPLTALRASLVETRQAIAQVRGLLVAAPAPLCKGRTRAGQSCRNRTRHPSGYCHLHRPKAA